MGVGPEDQILDGPSATQLGEEATYPPIGPGGPLEAQIIEPVESLSLGPVDPPEEPLLEATARSPVGPDEPSVLGVPGSEEPLDDPPRTLAPLAANSQGSPTRRPPDASVEDVDNLRTPGAANPSASCIRVYSRRRPCTESPASNAQNKLTKKTVGLLPQPPAVPKRRARAPPPTSVPRRSRRTAGLEAEFVGMPDIGSRKTVMRSLGIELEREHVNQR